MANKSKLISGKTFTIPAPSPTAIKLAKRIAYAANRSDEDEINFALFQASAEKGNKHKMNREFARAKFRHRPAAKKSSELIADR